MKSSTKIPYIFCGSPVIALAPREFEEKQDQPSRWVRALKIPFFFFGSPDMQTSNTRISGVERLIKSSTKISSFFFGGPVIALAAREFEELHEELQDKPSRWS